MFQVSKQNYMLVLQALRHTAEDNRMFSQAIFYTYFVREACWRNNYTNVYLLHNLTFIVEVSRDVLGKRPIMCQA